MPHPDAQPGPLSVHRAFVVQFGTHTDVKRGHLAGRVEHVVSGQAIQFHFLETLQAFMTSCCTRSTVLAATVLRERIHAQNFRA